VRKWGGGRGGEGRGGGGMSIIVTTSPSHVRPNTQFTRAAQNTTFVSVAAQIMFLTVAGPKIACICRKGLVFWGQKCHLPALAGGVVCRR
jgi:hypothetical protein